MSDEGLMAATFNSPEATKKHGDYRYIVYCCIQMTVTQTNAYRPKAEFE